MTFTRHRLGPPRSAGLSKGDRPLAMHRGRVSPSGDNARLIKGKTRTGVSGGARLIKGQTSVNKKPRLVVKEIETKPRRLLAPPKPRVALVSPTPAAPKPSVPKTPAPKVSKPVIAKITSKPVKPLPRRIEAVEEVAPRIFVKTLSNRDRENLFGRFSFKATPTTGNPEKVAIDPDWLAQNIVRIHVPALEGVQGIPQDAMLSFHRLVAPHFLILVDAWQKAGLLEQILSWNGSFASRFRRGHAEDRLLSAHAWASAFDLNTRYNPLNVEPAAPGTRGSMHELSAVAVSLGWIWGGNFLRYDGMHIEAGPGLIQVSKEEDLETESIHNPCDPEDPEAADSADPAECL